MYLVRNICLVSLINTISLGEFLDRILVHKYIFDQIGILICNVMYIFGCCKLVIFFALLIPMILHL